MKKRTNNGKAPDDLAALFAAINGAPAPDGAAPGDETGKAEVLAALADGSIFNAGADNLKRLAEAIRLGWLDEADVTDELRQKVVTHLGGRLRGGDPAERAAAAAALREVLKRPGAAVTPGGGAPSETAADGAAAAPPETGPDGGAAQASGKGGRSASGRFAKGNKCSKGNPFARKMALFRSGLLKSLDEGKLEALGERLYAAAAGGDWVAAELLLKYAVGRPAPAVDPDALDLMEWRLLRDGPGLAAVWHAAHEGADPGFACAVWRRRSAASADALLDQLAAAANSVPERFVADLAAERRAKVGK
jgi:hypothetical protein